MGSVGFFSLCIHEKTVNDMNDGCLVFLVKFFNIGQALQHGLILYVGNGIRVINKVIKGHLERFGQLFATSIDGVISLRSYLPTIGPLVPIISARCFWLQPLSFLSFCILSPINIEVT